MSTLANAQTCAHPVGMPRIPPRALSRAYFVLKLDVRGGIIDSDIFSEPSPTVCGPYRYTKPLVTVERRHYHQADARLCEILRTEARSDTKLGSLVRKLDRRGMLPIGLKLDAADTNAAIMELVQQIHCETCRSYAWHFGRMKPVIIARGDIHHPSCATLPGNRPAERAARLRASIGSSMVVGAAVR